MKRAVVINPQCDMRTAFASGLRRHGWSVECADAYRPCDLLVLWGVRKRGDIARQKEAGGEVCILERGYLADRYVWTSVSFGGGLNGRGEFRGPFSESSRWEKHFAYLLRPLRAESMGARVALVMGQVLGDQSLRGVDIQGFYNKAMNAFKAAGFLPKLRPHPGPVRRPTSGLKPLAEDLAGADVVVTYNSNSGVDAVLAGVPTVALDKGSMVYDVAGHALKMPPAPDRTAWAHRLAWCQWTAPEMESGYCWEAVSGR